MGCVSTALLFSLGPSIPPKHHGQNRFLLRFSLSKQAVLRATVESAVPKEAPCSTDLAMEIRQSLQPPCQQGHSMWHLLGAQKPSSGSRVQRFYRTWKELKVPQVSTQQRRSSDPGCTVQGESMEIVELVTAATQAPRPRVVWFAEAASKRRKVRDAMEAEHNSVPA